MIELSENKLNKLKDCKYRVYTKGPLTDGSECFPSMKSFSKNDGFCITAVNGNHIKHDNGKFYYTAEGLDETCDFFPAQILDVANNFVPCKKRKKSTKCTQEVGDDVGKKIDGQGCLIDVSGLPAFNGIYEDLSVFEYRFYLTLFNDYTVKQCQYERHNLQDATFTSSKYDLPAKLQSSDFLKSKDFTIINSRREREESVPVGLIIKESNNKYSLEYGRVYINMENKISIVWQ